MRQEGNVMMMMSRRSVRGTGDDFRHRDGPLLQELSQGVEDGLPSCFGGEILPKQEVLLEIPPRQIPNIAH